MNKVSRLWAPWRRKFLAHPRPKGCIFCQLPKSRLDRKNLILERGKTVFSMLNLYPYNNGHVLISPYRHLASPDLMTPGEWAELFISIKKTKKAIDKILKPQGYNMGMNIGHAAGPVLINTCTFIWYPGGTEIPILCRWLPEKR